MKRFLKWVGIEYQLSENSTTIVAGGQFERSLNGFRFQVNQTCPAS
jgi:hypothetical protein